MNTLSRIGHAFDHSARMVHHISAPTTTILVEETNSIGYITLNRPQHLNALNETMEKEVIHALCEFDKNKEVRCIVITGRGKAFAAGADIKEMMNLSFMDVVSKKMFSGWDDVKKIKKPIIAAVNGFAFGGGCELAMLCDIIIAADNAIFGQPEIKIGTIPGMGGTQRLLQAVGKSKAMEWCLTGQSFDAFTAERAGLVSRVVPSDQLLEEVERMAQKIASMSLPVVMLAKKSINSATETLLEGGIRAERNAFYSTFVLKDRLEGMRAFTEKRTPNWTNE